MQRMITCFVALATVAALSGGCARNAVVSKEDSTSPAGSQKTAAPKKDAPAQSRGPAAAAASGSNAIVPSLSSAEAKQKSSAQQRNPAVVYFGYDSYILSTEARNSLQSNFKIFEGRPRIQIEGHCDERGSSEYNLALGEKRAKTAQNYLEALGYPSDRISTISYGKERPADQGHDEAAWAKNRRDEFRIVK